MEYRSDVKTHARTHASLGFVWTYVSPTALVRIRKKVPNTHHEVAAAWAIEAETHTHTHTQRKGGHTQTHTHTTQTMRI